MSKSWDQIRPDNFFGPDLGQTVCKGYQQMTRVTASKDRDKCLAIISQKKKKIMPSAAVVIGVNM